MARNTNSSLSKTGGSFQRIIRAVKRKPLVFITPLLGIIIIVLLIVLLTGNAARSGADAVQTAEAEEETTPAFSYDENSWYMNMRTGFMTYLGDTDLVCSVGIDVSEWSKDINWEKVKASGIDFAICRVGYRGYGTGKFQFDEKLHEYLEGAEAAGIKTGVYFVTQAVNEEEAIEEANTVLDMIKDYHITMPVYIDSEANTGEETRTDNLTKEQFTKNAIAFCKTVEEAGYRGGVYSNETWIRKNLDMSQLTDYDIWFAKYTNTPSTDIPFTMWQYTASGYVDGLETSADLNVRIERP